MQYTSQTITVEAHQLPALGGGFQMQERNGEIAAWASEFGAEVEDYGSNFIEFENLPRARAGDYVVLIDGKWLTVMRARIFILLFKES